MLALLSPAKKLDYKPLGRLLPSTAPYFEKEVNVLAGLMRKLSRTELARLMKLSDVLAELNHQRYQGFCPLPSEEGKQAVFAFAGDTYQGFHAVDLSDDDIRFAQEHVRVLSGLYGLLRPLDRIQPHRLEMGTRLDNPKGATLYDFWKETITSRLGEEVAASKESSVIVLASEEYATAIDPARIGVPVITPTFHVIRNGKMRTQGMMVKRMRGAMARFLVQRRLRDTEELKNFREGGYVFRSDLSEGGTWQFAKDETTL